MNLSEVTADLWTFERLHLDGKKLLLELSQDCWMTWETATLVHQVNRTELAQFLAAVEELVDEFTVIYDDDDDTFKVTRSRCRPSGKSKGEGTDEN